MHDISALSQLQICRPLSLRSGHLDIKDAQSTKKNDRRKISYHIISRLGATGVQKGHFGHPNIQLSSKVAKFAGYIGIDLALIFCMNPSPRESAPWPRTL